jgi:hypothetical protein
MYERHAALREIVVVNGCRELWVLKHGNLAQYNDLTVVAVEYRVVECTMCVLLWLI